MKDLNGKFAIVTGGGKGIGRAIVERFLNENAAGVAILDWDGELAKKTALELDPTGKKVIAFKCDVAKSEAVEEAVKGVYEAFGRVDILVNNAGIIRDRIFHHMTDDEWYSVINVNLNGIYNLCKFIVPKMREQESGSIINISSTSAMGNPGQANYSATKAGMMGFTRTLAKELGRKNVRMNCVAPGYIDTEMMRSIGEEKLRAAIARHPMNRLGTPDELAAVVTFLASDDASWVTGQTIFTCGGTTTD